MTGRTFIIDSRVQGKVSVVTDRPLFSADLDRLRRGIYLEDGPTRAAHVEIVEEVKKNTWVEITITEGRNRLVKRMFWRIRNPVLKLLRVRFGNLTTDGLKPGAYRMLTKKELQALKALVH